MSLFQRKEKLCLPQRNAPLLFLPRKLHCLPLVFSFSQHFIPFSFRKRRQKEDPIPSGSRPMSFLTWTLSEHRKLANCCSNPVSITSTETYGRRMALWSSRATPRKAHGMRTRAPSNSVWNPWKEAESMSASQMAKTRSITTLKLVQAKRLTTDPREVKIICYFAIFQYISFSHQKLLFTAKINE